MFSVAHLKLTGVNEDAVTANVVPKVGSVGSRIILDYLVLSVTWVPPVNVT